MDDLISRQAAVDALDVLCQEHRYKIPGKVETYSQYNEAWQDALDRAEGAIGNLPSAQPERKKGKWIEDAETFYEAVNEKGGGVDADTPYFTEDDIACSECLALFSVIDNCTESFNYCPNCGADMRGEPDE